MPRLPFFNNSRMRSLSPPNHVQTPVEIIDGAYDYLMVIFLRNLFQIMAFNLLSNIFRLIGDAKTPLYFLRLLASWIRPCVVFGPGSEWVLEKGPDMTVSHSHASLYMEENSYFKIELKRLRCNFGRKRTCSHCSMAFQSSIIAIGAIIIQITLNQLGATAVSYTAAQKLIRLLFFQWCLFGAMATFVAQNYGAKNTTVFETYETALSYPRLAISVGINSQSV